MTDDSFYNDFEPAYLPNGDVVFASDRCDRAAECGPFNYDIPNCNLYVVSRNDGSIRQLTDNKDIDRYPYCLNNGQIAYTHWEYQERHFMEVHALWSARPDGTMSRALFKHHMKSPLGLRSVRSIPGSQKLLAIATGHHTFAHGPVVLVDPRHGPNDMAGIDIVTPGVRPQEGAMAGRPVAEGGVIDRGGLYQTPSAVSEKCFLVSYSYARENCTAPLGADSNGFAIYLIDVYGNKELLHRDPVLSCADPVPIRPRVRPPIIPTVAARNDVRRPSKAVDPVLSTALEGRRTVGIGPPTDFGMRSKDEATCYVTDVYDGMPEIPRGTVKYVRVAQHIGWPLDRKRGMMPYMPDAAYRKTFGYWSWSPVRVIGEVPVEADGSACFKVPADKAVYFQILDERHMEVRRMRSMASFKPGEMHGCRGCHELQAKAPTTARHSLLALQKPPRRLTPPPWGSDKLLGYEWLVQPILDRHCTRCHAADKADGHLDLTATRAGGGFYQSFHTLFGARQGQENLAGPLVVCSNRFSNSAVTRPQQFGSHASPLIQTLLADELHKKEVKLNQQEWYTLVTWIDANAPYQDKFINKRPPDGGPPKRNIVAASLRAP